MSDNFAQKVRQNAISQLIKNGISRSEANIEVDIIIKHIFGLNKKDLISQPDKILPDFQLNEFNKLLKERINKKIPVQYLTNTAYFMGYEFYVDENVLIPRPETEILVEKVVDLIKKADNPPKIIDIGTGSGCIACMLAKINNLNITASDISQNAIDVAKMNAERLNVKDKICFIKSDILANIEGNFDIIVSNPPYIPAKDREALQFEVSGHEPHLALFADDEKGISFYEKLIKQSEARLNPGGYIAVEIGIFQGKLITELLLNANFGCITTIKDYSGIDRIIIAKK